VAQLKLKEEIMTDKHQIENEMRVLKLNELTETLDIRLDQAQKDTGFYLAICQIEALQRTSFANRQPGPAFQV